MTDDQAGLIARLRRVKSSGYVRHTAENTFSTNHVYVNPDGPTAADEIERLIASTAQRIEARSDETPAEAVQPEGREPGPKDAPTLSGSGVVEEG